MCSHCCKARPCPVVSGEDAFDLHIRYEAGHTIPGTWSFVLLHIPGTIYDTRQDIPYLVPGLSYSYIYRVPVPATGTYIYHVNMYVIRTYLG